MLWYLNSEMCQMCIDTYIALARGFFCHLLNLPSRRLAFNVVHDSLRRKSGEYQEQYNHDGDSAGIHGSGAGFPKMDAADKWVPPEY